MHIAEWLTLVGILVAVLIVAIPAVWKKVWLTPYRELRRIYRKAAKEVSRADKGLRKELRMVIKESRFWRKARSEAVTYIEEKKEFRQAFTEQVPAISPDRVKIIAESFYKAVYDGLTSAHHDCWQKRAQRWDKERGKDEEGIAEGEKQKFSQARNSIAPIPNIESPLDWSAAQVFFPPHVSRNFIDRDDDRQRLLRLIEEDKEDEAKVIWIAEPTDRGKTDFARKVFEEIKKRPGWQALFIDIIARREQVVTLDILLAAFASILKKLLPSESTDKSPSDHATQDEFPPVYATLVDGSTPLWIRAYALVTILEQHQYHWFITLDEYDWADSSLEDFVIAVANHAKHTKLLLIGQDYPRVLREREVSRGSHQRFGLQPLHLAHTRKFLAVASYLQNLTGEEVQAIYQKCGNGEPGLMQRFIEESKYLPVSDLLRQDISAWSDKAKEDVNERIRMLSTEACKVLRVACLFPEPVERSLLEEVSSDVISSNSREPINSLINHSLLQFDGACLEVDTVIRQECASLPLVDEERLQHIAGLWLDNQRVSLMQTQSARGVEEQDRTSLEKWLKYTRRAFQHYQLAHKATKALACADDLWAMADDDLVAIGEDRKSLCKRALELCEQANDDAARASWLRREAGLLYQDRKSDEAYRQYCQSLHLDKKLGNKRGQAQTEAALSWLYYESSAYGDAYEYARSSLALSRETADKLTQADVLHVMGLVDGLYKEYSKALTTLREARALLQEIEGESDAVQKDIDEIREDISMRTILTTVGTSLLGNAKRDLYTEDLNDQQLANYLRHTAAAKASAETNSLSRLLTEGDDRIVFLCSQTGDGKRCAESLAQHFESAEYRTGVIEVPDLTYAEKHFKMRGLKSLVETLVKQIRDEKAKDRTVIINATGGFKAEIAYATLVGLLFNVPVYYIHEAFREIIEMPPTPISWDYTLLADYEDFFGWLHQDLRTIAEVDARLRSVPTEARPKIALLLATEEDYTFLSPVGEAFYEAYLYRLQQAEQQTHILWSAQARETYQEESADVQRLFDRMLKKLRLRELRFGGSDRVHNSDCLIFPKGHRPERLFYFESEDGSVRVCELARHTDQSYEHLLQRGVWREDYSDFRKLDET